jgi:hypothetical protein
MGMGYSIAPGFEFTGSFTPEKADRSTDFVKEEREIDSAVENFRHAFRNREINVPEFGSLLGAQMIMELRKVHSDPSLTPSQKAELVQSVHRTMKPVVEGAGLGSYDVFKVGFLGEYSCMSAIDKIGYPVEFAVLEQDTRHGVDFMVDLEDPLDSGVRVLAVQVKTLKMFEEPPEILYPIFSSQEVNDLCQKIPTTDTNIDAIYSSTNKLLAYANQFDFVLPVVIILPSPESDFGLFNAQNGLPTKEMLSALVREMDTKVLQIEEGVYAQ